MRAVIMAGGKGSRIASLFTDIPKPMIPIGGKPLLVHQINCLKRQGITDITLVIGYLGEKIRSFFGDGKNFGVNIDYFIESEPQGSAGALFDILPEHDFLLINGDLMFDVNFDRLIDFHFERGALATLFAHPNSHPFDSSLLVTDSLSRVTAWSKADEQRYSFRNLVNAGIHVISPELIKKIGYKRSANLDNDILLPCVGSGSLFAFNSADYVMDVGTPERYERVCRDYERGIIKPADKLRAAFFLDRDGTLNIQKGLITSAEEIVLLDGVAQAVCRMNDAGYPVFIVTNQPQVARGLCSSEEICFINGRLEALLAEKGAYVNDVFFCPHHPDSGFEGEVRELKIDCSCRKPKPGMLLEAAKKHGIDLSRSFMVGDRKKDIDAGKAAGCRTAFILSDSKDVCPADCESYANLLNFVDSVL